MAGSAGNFLTALLEIWKSIGIAQKVSIILIGLVTVGVSAAVIYAGSRPDWQVLYSELDSKTASKINDIVNDEGIPVKYADGGRTIMVPSKNVYKLRMKVASAGVAVEKKGAGWEIIDDMKLGATDMQQQIAKQRAIQGELERMISEMPGIASCKVMITVPPKSVFKKDKVHPTASIMLVLQPGSIVGSKEINGIRFLVSGAVTGMNPEDVNISDNRGNLLARQNSTEADSVTGESGRQFEVQEKIERQLKEKAEAILRPIVGQDKVVAMVSCDVDFNNVDRVIEQYDPEKTVVLSEKTIVEDNTKQRAVVGGGAGADANLVNVRVSNPNGAAEEKQSSENRKTAERVYAVPKTVEKVTVKGARIKKLTVAVTVAKKAEGSWDTKEFEKLVSAAVGASNYDMVQGHDGKPVQVVTVREMDFAQVEKPAAISAPLADTIVTNMERITESPIVRPIAGLVLLGVLFGLFKKYFSRSVPESGESQVNAVYGEDVKQISADDEKSRSEIEGMLDTIQTKAAASPQAVASIMENWLSSEQ